MIYPLYKSESPKTIKVRYDIKLVGTQPIQRVPFEILKVPFVFDNIVYDFKMGDAVQTDYLIRKDLVSEGKI